MVPKTNRWTSSISAGFTVAIALSASSLSAQESGPYVSVGTVYATSDANEIEQVSEDSGLIQSRAGYALSRHFAAEAEGSIAVLKPGAGDAGSTDARFILDRSFAGFVTARYPATDQFSVFVRGGYHYSRLNVRADGNVQTAWRDGFAYGAGASYRLDDDGAIRFDYTILKTAVNSQAVRHRLVALSYVKSF